MDSDQFDRLTRTLASAATRRTMLGLATALGLSPLLADVKKRKKKKKSKKKKCQPQSTDVTCAGLCGTVRNNCQQSVDCGPCCASSAECQTSGLGNLCCAGLCVDGECCDSAVCGGTNPFCVDHVCTACSASHPCPTGQCCQVNGACGMCLVFVTAQTPNGNIGGLDSADALCQAEADEAGLPGDYRAWLSDTDGSPSTRFVRATDMYWMVSGHTLAANWTDLTDGGLLINGLDRDAHGTAVTGAQVWTNTQPEGTPGGINATGRCMNWTSASVDDRGNVGVAGLAHNGWTREASRTCDSLRRLYCFQQR